jgi:16S rRNA processing protein RimM
LKIGQIVGPHGIRGLVKVEPLTDFDEHFEAGARVRIGDNWYEITSCSWHKNRPLLGLSGVDSMNAAEELRWKFLEAFPLEDPDLEDDEYLVEDLLECRVVTEEGEDLGVLDEVEPMPAQDVYRVGEIRIPAVKEFVREIDLENKVITVRLIPGMRGEDVD